MLSRNQTVLLVGGGGREHALAWKLSQSERIGALYAAPGNAGIAQLATCLPVSATDIDGQVAAARDVGADLVVVCPENPLALGLVDRLIEAGIPAVGPTAAAARIESSKQFAKDLMTKAGIPTAAYDVVTTMDEATAVINGHFHSGEDPAPLVVKADGLAFGKGVVICHTDTEAREAAAAMLSGDAFGSAGRTVVLEEFLTGPELSVMVFSDGRRIVPMPPARDYKRLLDGDEGPNTGGMGTITPAPDCPRALHDDILRRCVQPAIDALADAGTPFRGILFAGIMLTAEGPKVLEFNARFGDPETQSVLRRLDSDLLDVLAAVATGDVSAVRPVWSDQAACCVIMASAGYPGAYETGTPIVGIDTVPDGVVVFHSGTALDEDGRILTNGGRVLGVTATGNDLREAVATAYAAVEHIHFEGRRFRSDLGRDGRDFAALGQTRRRRIFGCTGTKSCL